MKKFLTLLIMAAFAAIADSNGPAPNTSMVLVRGDEVFPSNIIASSSEALALSNQVAELNANILQYYLQSTNILAQSEKAVALAAPNGDIVYSTVFVSSTGAKTSAGTNQIVEIVGFAVDTENGYATIDCAFDKVQSKSPAITFSTALTNNFETASVLSCSWPLTVENSKTPNGYYCYRFVVSLASKPNVFFRCVSTDTAGQSSGLYMLVRNGISVDGQPGADFTIVDDFGKTIIGKGGIVVEEVSQ